MSDNTALQNDIAEQAEAAAPKVESRTVLNVGLELSNDANITAILAAVEELGKVTNFSLNRYEYRGGGEGPLFY